MVRNVPAAASPTMPNPRPFPRYLTAIAAVVLAALARVLIAPVTGPQYLYATYFVAAVCIAWYAGTGPAALAFALGLVVAEWQFASLNPGGLTRPDHLAGVVLYGLTGLTTQIGRAHV